MRCFLLIAFCLSSTFAYEFNTEWLSTRIKVPNVQLHLESSEALRAKRDTRIHVRPLEDPDYCIKNCTYKMNDGLLKNDTDDSKTAQIANLCKSTTLAAACYKSCPDSQFKALMLDFLPLIRQPCLLGDDQYPGLKKNLDCLNTTADPIAAKCDPVCNGSFAGDIRLDSRILLNVDPAFVMYDDDKTENRDVLKSTCSYITCSQQCGDSITKAKCGQQGLDVDRKITSSIFGSITKLYTDLNALDGPVKECSSLL